MASKTPKQDEHEDDFNPNDVTPTDNTKLTNLPEKQTDIILTKVTKPDGEADDEYRWGQAFVKQQLSHHETDSSSDTEYFIQFVTKSSCHHPVMNQVSQKVKTLLNLAQLKDSDIQRIIHIIRDGELPPSHVNFQSRLFQKLFKNQN